MTGGERCHKRNEPLLKELDRIGQNRPFQRGSRVKAKWGLARYPVQITSGDQARAVRGVQDLFAEEIDQYLARHPPEPLDRLEELEFFMERIGAVDRILRRWSEQQAADPGSAPAPSAKKPRRKPDASRAEENRVIGYSTDGSYVMLLDNRERKNEVTETLAAEPWCVSCQLPIGDMLWAYRCDQITMNPRSGCVETRTKYYLTGLIIERKTHRDLSNSIVDERYKTQGQRLKAFVHDPALLPVPLRQANGARAVRGFVLLLIEKNRTLDLTVVNMKAVETAVIKYHCRDGFYVIHSDSNAHTAQLLSSIHNRIVQQPRKTPTNDTANLVSFNAETTEPGLLNSQPPGGADRLSIGTSGSLYAKSSAVTTHDILKKQLRMIPNVQPADVEYLLNDFANLNQLLHAL